MSLVFGIYPGGAAGGDSGLLSGPPDDPLLIRQRVGELRGLSRLFVVRCYDSFQDPDSLFLSNPCAPANYSQYATSQTPMELVLQFRSASGDIPGYLDFLRARIERHAPNLYAVQITEEANFTDGPNVIDGPYPNVRRALVEGVISAKRILTGLGHPEVKVGFNATPTFGPSAEFWPSLRAGGAAFVEALDYVGLDFFPDVFRPAGDIAGAVTGVLEAMRDQWLADAGIPPSVRIHITEHGWPTCDGRSLDRQAEVLDTVVRTLASLSSRLNIERYTLFSLRDVDHRTDANAANPFRFFGIVTAGYDRKPAFQTLRNLVDEFGPR
jgi:hypothetical protein